MVMGKVCEMKAAMSVPVRLEEMLEVKQIVSKLSILSVLSFLDKLIDALPLSPEDFTLFSRLNQSISSSWNIETFKHQLVCYGGFRAFNTKDEGNDSVGRAFLNLKVSMFPVCIPLLPSV